MTDPLGISPTLAGSIRFTGSGQPVGIKKPNVEEKSRPTGSGQALGFKKPSDSVESKSRFTGSGQATGSKTLPTQSQEALNMERAIKASLVQSQEELDMERAIKASLDVERDESVVPEYLIRLAQNAQLGLRKKERSQGVETPAMFKTKSLKLAEREYWSPEAELIYDICDDETRRLLFRMHLLDTPSDEDLPYIINGFQIFYDATSNTDATREFGRRLAMYKEMQNYRTAMRLALQMS